MFNLQMIDGEPRIYDLELAERLGMFRWRDIRKDLIKPNFDELQELGDLRAVPANRKGPGRKAMEFYLNEEQALLVCMFSRTQRAAEVRKQVIDTFVRFRKGDITLADEIVQKNESKEDLEWLKARTEGKQIRKSSLVVSQSVMKMDN